MKRKKISKMTAEDKAEFLAATKASFVKDHGIPWEEIEPKILAEIDASFDDEKFVKMDPEFRIDILRAAHIQL